jgi:hypothetical protein
MAAWKLSNKEWDAVDELRFSTKEAAVFRNATIILISAAGCSKPSIANDLGCSVGTVDNIRKAYRQRGLQGLIPGKPSGRPSRATPEYRAALRAAVETPPPGTGLRFQRLVAGPPEHPPPEADRYPFQRRSVGADHASGEVFVSTSQAHYEREAGRGGLQASYSQVARAQKKRSAMTPTKR